MKPAICVFFWFIVSLKCVSKRAFQFWYCKMSYWLPIFIALHLNDASFQTLKKIVLFFDEMMWYSFQSLVSSFSKTRESTKWMFKTACATTLSLSLSLSLSQKNNRFSRFGIESVVSHRDILLHLWFFYIFFLCLHCYLHYTHYKARVRSPLKVRVSVILESQRRGCQITPSLRSTR